MTSEALGVSVAPSFFHSCVSDGKTAKMEDVMKFKVSCRFRYNSTLNLAMEHWFKFGIILLWRWQNLTLTNSNWTMFYQRYQVLGHWRSPWSGVFCPVLVWKCRQVIHFLLFCICFPVTRSLPLISPCMIKYRKCHTLSWCTFTVYWCWKCFASSMVPRLIHKISSIPWRSPFQRKTKRLNPDSLKTV